MNRPPEFYRNLMVRMNEILKASGMTQREVVIVASQFVGLAIADAPVIEQEPQLLVATRAMKTACATKIMARNPVEFFKDGT